VRESGSADFATVGLKFLAEHIEEQAMEVEALESIYIEGEFQC
jgi:hypothetical protein